MDENALNTLRAKNEALFASYKPNYPTLSQIYSDQGYLIFPNGQKVDLATFDLSTLPPEILWMNSNNLYIYLSNRFFIHNKEQYSKDIKEVLNIFSKFIITEDDENILKRFSLDFWLRLKLFNNESALEQDEEYVEELMARRNIVTKSQNEPSIAGNIITNSFNSYFNESTTSESMTNTGMYNTIPSLGTPESLIESNVFSLSRSKPGLPKVVEDDSKFNLNAAGFTSIMLILGTALIVGVLLGLALFK